jgi:hypothetical protein
VTKLVSRSDVHQTRIRLDRGRTWNRVTKLSNSQSSYEVETPSAVAAVRGTAFVVDCRTATCVFTVIDGTVVVTTTDGRTITLTAGQSTSVGPTTAAALTTTPAVADDPWVLKNQARDNGGSAPVPTASSTPAVQTLHIGQTATVDGDRVTVSNLTLSKTICERTGLDYMSKPPCQKGEEFFDYDPPPNTTNYHVGTRVADLEVCRGAGKPPLDLAGAFILSPYNSGTSDHSGQPASLELDNPNPLRDALKPHVQFKPDPPLAAGACRRGFTVLPTAKTPGEAIEYFDTTGPYRHGLAARWPLA